MMRNTYPQCYPQLLGISVKTVENPILTRFLVQCTSVAVYDLRLIGDPIPTEGSCTTGAKCNDAIKAGKIFFDT